MWKQTQANLHQNYIIKILYKMSQKRFYNSRIIITGLFIFGIICINDLKAQNNVFNVTKITDTVPFSRYNYNDALCDTNMIGTLQWAIRKTNDAPPPSTIHFNIPGTGTHTIILNSALPPINKQVTIDGSSQPGYLYNNGPSIIIDGTNILIYYYCFHFTSSDDSSSVIGIHIQNFWASCGVTASTGHIKVKDCMFWAVGGQEPGYPWISQPIYIAGPHATIQGNIIGTDITGTQNHTCAGGGIYLQGQSLRADNCLIGGSGQNESNLIAFTSYFSIIIDNATYDKISRNRLYNNSTGISLLRQAGYPDWGNDGKANPVFDTITYFSNVTGSSSPGDSIELFGSTGPKNTNKYLTTVKADAYGKWSASLSDSSWSYIAATATAANNNTSEIAISNQIIHSSTCSQCQHLRFCFPDIICAGEDVTIINGSTDCSAPGPLQFLWKFGDGDSTTINSLASVTHTYLHPGSYLVTLSTAPNAACVPVKDTLTIHVTDCSQPCINCISSFAPEPGKKYIITAWVKEDNPPVTKTSYNNPQIYIVFPGLDSNTTALGPYKATGNIIDGWQRVDSVFNIPATATNLKIRLKSVAGNSYFDDIRIFPFDATVKSYVYDPINLRLVSELDERNYATFYEYDEEGKLIRVKKETERGIMTIKETRNSISKN
jgi:hypothetical protein